MIRRAPMIFALTALAALLAVAVLRTTAEARSPGEAPQATPSSPGGSPVVLELFTSQGCSSCPPADRLLSRLGREGLDGVAILPLSFHVDYWNYIGWQDPFSQPRWSQRQEGYAKALGTGRLYTPQVVVQGQEDCVGSGASCVEDAVARVSRRPSPARLTAELRSGSEGEIVLEASARFSPDAAATGSTEDLEAVVIVFEKGLETPVRRGENAHKTLKNDYVVRRLEPVFRVPGGRPEAGETAAGKLSLRLDPEWTRDRLGVAVLLQEVHSRRILAAWVQEGSL